MRPVVQLAGRSGAAAVVAALLAIHLSIGSMTLDREHYEGLAGFRLALRRFLAASEAISRRGGITQQQYQAMLLSGLGHQRP